MATIGIADTMFARYDMGALAEQTIKEANPDMKIIRYTVPGFKDLAVASKKLLEEHDCEIVIALAMVGKEPIDKQCSQDASFGIQQAQLLTNKHILEVFVHEDEAEGKELIKIFEDRTIKHTVNALDLLKGKDVLRHKAGKGVRQGSEDAGEIE